MSRVVVGAVVRVMGHGLRGGQRRAEESGKHDGAECRQDDRHELLTGHNFLLVSRAAPARWDEPYARPCRDAWRPYGDFVESFVKSAAMPVRTWRGRSACRAHHG